MSYTWRRMWHSPGVNLLTVSALALGIGSTSAIFGVVNAVLFSSGGIPDLDRVLTVRYGEAAGQLSTVAFPDYRAIREAPRTPFSNVAAVITHGPGFVVNGSGQAEPVQGEFVSADYFRVLGQEPRIGHLTLANNDLEPASMAVISEALWRRWFNAESNAIGRSITVAGVPVTIVGVTHRVFGGARRPTVQPTDIWVPLGLFESPDGTSPSI